MDGGGGGVGGVDGGVAGTAPAEGGDAGAIAAAGGGSGVQTPFLPGGANLPVPPAVLALSGLGGTVAPEEHGADTGGLSIPIIEGGNHQQHPPPPPVRVGSFATSIEAATGPVGLTHGDEDLFVDNGGWVTDEAEEDDEESEDELSDLEEDDDDDDPNEGELIQLIGHL